jgi:hypothetical protein
MPECPECGQRESRYISQFAAVWASDLDKYVDRRVDGWEKPYSEGLAHWAYRKNNLREGEKPHAVYIDSIQKQAEYCRAEGLENPKYAPSAGAFDDQGKRTSGCGLPGAWV